MPSTPSGPRALGFNVLLLLPALAVDQQDIVAPEPPTAEVSEAPRQDTAGAEQGEPGLRPLSVYQEISRRRPTTTAEIDLYNGKRRAVKMRLKALTDNIVDEATKIVYQEIKLKQAMYEDMYGALDRSGDRRVQRAEETKFRQFRAMYEILEKERKDRDVANQEIIAAKLEGRPKNLSKMQVRIKGLGKNDREQAEEGKRRFDEFQEELKATERFADRLQNAIRMETVLATLFLSDEQRNDLKGILANFGVPTKDPASNDEFSAYRAAFNEMVEKHQSYQVKTEEDEDSQQARAQPMAAASSTVESDFLQDELSHGVTATEAAAAAETTSSTFPQTEQRAYPADESPTARSAESISSSRADAPADSGDSTDEPMLQAAQESPTTDSSTEAVSMASRQEEDHAAAQSPSAGDVTVGREKLVEALAEEPLWWALQAAAMVPF